MNENRYLAFIKNVLNASHSFDDSERLLMYKFQTLMAIIIFSSFVVFVMTFVRYAQGYYVQAIADFAFVLVALACIYALHRTKKSYYSVARVILFSGFSIAIWLLHSVPESQSRVIWFGMIITTMFFMLNKKEGLYWLGVIVAILTLLFVSVDAFYLSGVDFIIFIANLIMISLVLLWYETIKEDNERYIKNYAQELECEISKRTHELQEALVQTKTASKSKEAFFANMSHELRTPLNAIIGFSQILSKQKNAPENIKPFIEKIHISGNSLLRLINSILNFSKIESENMKLTLQTLSLRDFLEDVLVLVEPQMKKKSIKLTLLVEDARVCIDPQLLGQAILNLLSNAVKFTHENGEIKIEAKEKNSSFFLKVCDNGVGITQENQEKLFKPFSQVANEYQAKVDGTGLGLYLTQKIVALHGGSITLQSKLGEGSCFNIEIKTPQLNA